MKQDDRRKLSGIGKENTVNIFDQAMKFEQKGMHYYHELAKRSWDPSMKKIFSWLAVQEEQHFKLLKSMKKVSTIPPHRTVSFRPLRGLLRSIGKSMVVAEVTLSQLAAYRVALRMERNSEAFYLKRAKQAGRGPLRRTLAGIAGEEARHGDTIEYIIAGMDKKRLKGNTVSS